MFIVNKHSRSSSTFKNKSTNLHHLLLGADYIPCHLFDDVVIHPFGIEIRHHILERLAAVYPWLNRNWSGKSHCDNVNQISGLLINLNWFERSVNNRWPDLFYFSRKDCCFLLNVNSLCKLLFTVIFQINTFAAFLFMQKTEPSFCILLCLLLISAFTHPYNKEWDFLECTWSLTSF